MFIVSELEPMRGRKGMEFMENVMQLPHTVREREGEREKETEKEWFSNFVPSVE